MTEDDCLPSSASSRTFTRSPTIASAPMRAPAKRIAPVPICARAPTTRPSARGDTAGVRRERGDPAEDRAVADLHVVADDGAVVEHHIRADRDPVAELDAVADGQAGRRGHAPASG